MRSLAADSTWSKMDWRLFAGRSDCEHVAELELEFELRKE